MIAGAVGGAIIVGSHKGAQNHADVYRTSRHAVYMTALLCTIIPVFFAAFPEALSFLFNSDDPEILKLLKQIIVLVALGQIGDGAAYAQMLQLRVFNETWVATVLRGACLALGAVTATALVYNSNIGIASLGVGYALAEWSSCLVLGIRLHYVMQKYRKEYNVLAPASNCIPKTRNLSAQSEWGFMGRNQQQRYVAQIAAIDSRVATRDSMLELV